MLNNAGYSKDKMRDTEKYPISTVYDRHEHSIIHSLPAVKRIKLWLRFILKRLIVLLLLIQAFLTIRVWLDPEGEHIQYIHHFIKHHEPNKSINPSKLYEKMMFNTEMIWPDEYSYKNNLLTVQIGQNKGQILQSIDDLKFYDNDPRLIWSVLLDYLSKEGPDQIPFSWYDWSDYQQYNRILALSDEVKSRVNCAVMYSPGFDKQLLLDIEAEINEPLFQVNRHRYSEQYWYKVLARKAKFINLVDYCSDGITSRFDLPVNIKKPQAHATPEQYEFQNKAFMMRSKLHMPFSLTILNKDRSFFQVPISTDINPQNIIESELLAKFIENNKINEDDQDLVFNHTILFDQFLESKFNEKYKLKNPELTDRIHDELLVHVKENDFIFDPLERIAYLEKEEHLTTHQRKYLESLKYSITVDPLLQKKHFNEARDLLLYSKSGSHRDARFFYNSFNPDIDGIEYQMKMNSLIRNFLKFTKANGLITWLSHGTLFSHLYNGLTFPWDDDFDLQMPIRHLNMLAEHFNQSLILEDPREGNGRFLLDVSSTITIRTNGNGNNNIDARFIDVDSGIYIDITGLSVSSQYTPKYAENYIVDRPNDKSKSSELEYHNYEPFKYGFNQDNFDDLSTRVRNNEILSMEEKDTLLKLAASESQRKRKNKRFVDEELSSEQRFTNHLEKKLYNCRNGHFISFDSLSPLYNSIYHGQSALIPRKPIQHLEHEYKLTKTYGFLTFEGNIYLPGMKLWYSFKDIRNIIRLAVDQSVPIPTNLHQLRGIDHYFLLKAFLIQNMHDAIAITHNTFEATSFRLKELEIMFDRNLSFERIVDAFKVFRREKGRNIMNPFKDPTLFSYEKRLFNKLVKDKDVLAIAKIKENVCSKLILRTWHSIQEILEKRYNGFEVIVNDNEPHNLNYAGLNYENDENLSNYPVFESDSDLIENIIVQ